MPNTNLFNYIDEHLIDFRKLPNSDPLWEKLHNDKLAQLAWCFAMRRLDWNRLKPWEKTIARVYAHGRAAPRAVLIDKAAALIHGIPLTSYPNQYHATVPSNSIPAKGKGHFFRYKQTDLKNQVEEIHGVRVSTLARTALDISRFYGFEQGIVAVDSIRSRYVGMNKLNHVLGSMGRVKGIAKARQALKHSVCDSESPWESYARALIINANIPGLRTIKAQRSIMQYRADILINDWLVIEIDGNVKYEFCPDEVIRAEHRRQKALLNRGYAVLRYAPNELSADPDGFLSDIRWHIENGHEKLREA